MKKNLSILLVSFFLLGGLVTASPAFAGTEAEMCESIPGNKYFSDMCMTMAEYCTGQGQDYDTANNSCLDCPDGQEFDLGAGGCYDPNLQQGGLLPGTELEETECEVLFRYDSMHLNTLKNIVKTGTPEALDLWGAGVDHPITPLDVLGCAIKTGRIKLWMVPFYIKYLIQFALSVAGLIAVGGIMVGGYFYLFGGLMDDKDKGKRAIIYGAVGFVVAILAWAIVNIVMVIVTQ